ncbi:hypothetical protein ACFLUY_00760 [Chloroflexota bacterium]
MKSFNNYGYFPPYIFSNLGCYFSCHLVGIIWFWLLTLTMHLARFVGQKYGVLVKAMLVRT